MHPHQYLFLMKHWDAKADSPFEGQTVRFPFASYRSAMPEALGGLCRPYLNDSTRKRRSFESSFQGPCHRQDRHRIQKRTSFAASNSRHSDNFAVVPGRYEVSESLLLQWDWSMSLSSLLATVRWKRKSRLPRRLFPVPLWHLIVIAWPLSASEQIGFLCTSPFQRLSRRRLTCSCQSPPISPCISPDLGPFS